MVQHSWGEEKGTPIDYRRAVCFNRRSSLLHVGEVKFVYARIPLNSTYLMALDSKLGLYEHLQQQEAPDQPVLQGY